MKTRLRPASLSFKGQASKHTTVKWSIPCIQESLYHRLLRTLTPFLRLRTFKIFVDVRISPNLFYVKAIIDRLIV